MFLGLALGAPGLFTIEPNLLCEGQNEPRQRNPSNPRFECVGVVTGARYCESGCGWNHYLWSCNLRRVVPIRTAGHFDWLPYSFWSR